MKTSGILKIKCPECQAEYSIPENKKPAKAVSLKCKKCGHRIPLSQKPSISEPSTAKQSETVQAETNESETIHLICAKCNRKYRFPPSKIPRGVTSVKCKICNHQMAVGHLLPDASSKNRETCKKCGYQRTLKDDRLYSRESCPKCGLLYSKGKLFEAKKGMNANPDSHITDSVLDTDVLEPSASQRSPSMLKPVLIGMVLLLAAAGGYLFFFSSKTGFENTIGMKFVYIPPGTFIMGSPPDETGREPDETPHRVTITKGFYIQATETTQAQWRRLSGYKVSTDGEPCENCPVVNLTFKHVQNFIDRLNRREGGGGYRLPTEAEWEYACRSGTGAAFSFGRNPELIEEYAWYAENSDSRTHKVAQKKPNPAGLYDMHGNAAEMCLDWYGPYPDENVIDPAGPSKGDARVLRGGSWFDRPENIRSGSRSSMKPGYKSVRVGFRLVAERPPG